jgi:hypothetical protein
METKRLLSIAGYNKYYTICSKDLETNEINSIITYPTFSKFVSGFTTYDLQNTKIIFDNEDILLTRYLIDTYKDYLVESKTIFNTRKVGVVFSQNVKSYGYNEDAVKSVEYATNIEKYISNKILSL